MKITGYYCSVESDYDVDHEINKEVANIKEVISGINDDGSDENRKAILKAIANEIIESI